MDITLKTIQPVTPKHVEGATCATCVFWRDGQDNHVGDCYGMPQITSQHATRPACALYTPRAEKA